MDKQWLLKTGDIFFFIFHIALIVFNLFGWILKSMRRWNLITLSLTAFSWFILGIFYGFGYCFLTDWHWQIRAKLGYQTTSDSYIHFLIYEITGLSTNEAVVDLTTAILFFSALAISIVLNIRDRKNLVND